MPSTVNCGASVWNGITDTPARGEVLVTDGRIAAVGPSVPRPDGALAVDLTGHTVLPGLIDCHTYVSSRRYASCWSRTSHPAPRC